ncbi:MAG: right-handed parallel beta-helix repeat-containing protein, partial [Halobacteriaceae archaeon]
NGDITFTGGMRPKYIHILNSKINGSISVESDFFEPFKSNPKPPILLVNNTVDGSVSIDYFLNAKVSRNRIHGHLGLNVRSASILKNHLIGRSSKTGIGVNVRESAQIMNNEIHQFKYGIHIGGEVIDISIINNHIYNNSYGIHLPAIRIGNNTITDNSIVSNTKAGILLGPDHRSTWYLKGKQVEITSNIISFNRRGIVVREVGYTTIFAKHNTITHNKRVGILIKQTANSPGHKFTKSLIENNSIGFKAATNTKAVIKKNYWGAASGPHHPSINPSGKGNNVTGKLSNVNLIPFAKTRIDEAPIPPIVDLQWNAPQITLSTKNDVTVSKYILWVEDVHRHSTTRSQLKLDLSSGRHTISVFGINKRGFEGPLHKETITIRTPTPSPTPSPTPPPTRTSSVTPSKAEQTTTAGKSTRQSMTTRRDSDGDGVPDTEDYAPRDPNVQKRSDIQDRGDGRSIVQPGFGVRVTILALLGILILAWWHRTGDE